MGTDIISYDEMCSRENNVSLQHGMNFGIGGTYSVILMSQAPNAPYVDELKDNGLTLIYEGHDVPRYRGIKDPKSLDQPQTTPKGTLTPNGKFYFAAQNFKSGKKDAEKVRVYEKIKPGIWAYNGVFKLTDSWIHPDGKRNVFKFRLEAISDEVVSGRQPVENRRVIPTKIKQEVWKRDGGKCVKCGSKDHLHFDHIIHILRVELRLLQKTFRFCVQDTTWKKETTSYSVVNYLHKNFSDQRLFSLTKGGHSIFTDNQ